MRLRWLVLLVSGVHAALLVGWHAAHPRIRAGSSDGVPSMRARLQAVASPVLRPRVGVPDTPARTLPTSAPADVDYAPHSIASGVEESVPLASASFPSAGLNVDNEQGKEYSGYLPRSLTRTPSALSPLEIPFPREVTGLANLTLVLSLYIDEEGVVRYVRIDSDNVPPLFAQAAQQAFQSARFKPGEVDQIPVRSRMRIEVAFESDPTPRTDPAQPPAPAPEGPRPSIPAS